MMWLFLEKEKTNEKQPYVQSLVVVDASKPSCIFFP